MPDFIFSLAKNKGHDCDFGLKCLILNIHIQIGFHSELIVNDGLMGPWRDGSLLRLELSISSPPNYGDFLFFVDLMDESVLHNHLEVYLDLGLHFYMTKINIYFY